MSTDVFTTHGYLAAAVATAAKWENKTFLACMVKIGLYPPPGFTNKGAISTKRIAVA